MLSNPAVERQFNVRVLTLYAIGCMFVLASGSSVFAKTGSQTPREMLEQAKTFERRADYPHAIAAYRHYLRVKPEDDEARSVLAKLLAWQGAYDEAGSFYRDILTRHPTDLDVQIGLGRVLSWQKHFKEARRLFEHILQEDANRIEAVEGLGDVLFWSGQDREALPYYKRVYNVTHDPAIGKRIDSIKTHLLVLASPKSGREVTDGMAASADALVKARQLETAKRYREAIAAYRTYLLQHPRDDEVRANVAKLMAWEGRHEEAVTLYREILSRHPGDLDIRIALATVLSWRKQFTDAKLLYEDVLRKDVHNREASRGLADVLFWQGHHADALARYESLYAEQPDAELSRQIQAVKTEMNLSPRAPVGQEDATLRLPYRDYAKVGYGHYTYTKDIPDEWNALLEGGTSLGDKTLIARVESLNRFGFHDAPVSAEFYSPLWSRAWGYLGAQGTVNPHFAPNYSVVGEMFQGFGAAHSGLSPFEGSFGYRHLRYKKDGIDLLMPGLTVYFPHNVWLTEKVYYIPDTGAITLASQLTWRPQDRLQFFASGAFGTSGERIVATQDFTRVQSRIIQGGVIFPLTKRFSAEASGYYEDRGVLYIRRGGLINLIYHW